MSSQSDVVPSILKAFSGKVSELELNPPQSAILVDAAAIRDVFEYLRKDTEFKFDYLSCLSGVDAVEHLEVVYHIFSTETKCKLTVKVKLPPENPEIDSICDIYKAANWYERELSELYGIKVNVHPDMRLLLLPDDWDQGHPMRKGWTGDDFVVMPEK